MPHPGSKNLAILLLAALPVVTLPAVAWGADRPNVIVIISDDAGWADFGLQDPITGLTTNVPTPRLDALANSGVRFSNAYTASVCSPSRAMITTGMYGGRFGYESNITSSNGPVGTGLFQGLPTSITTIWEQMQSIGYATAAVGKWHLGAHENNGAVLGNKPENQGIETFEGIIAGSRGYFLGSSTGDQALRRTLSDGAGGGVTDQVIENQFNGEYVTDVFGDLTVDYIAANHDGEKPFFMYSSFTAPHTPMQATAADLADPRIAGLSGDRKTYAAMQIALDRNVGKIMDAINDPDGDGDPGDSIADNTLVIFLNDNGGDCCDAQPNFSSNGPLRNGKGSQYEGGLRIPMVIAGAGVSPSVAGTTFDHPVHAIDIVPTAFAAGGGVFQPGETIDGVDLVPYVNGTITDAPHESLYIRRANNNQSAVRVGDWKLMYRDADGEFSLYNLATDIGESNNVAAANPDIVDQLKRVMTDYDVQMDKARYDNRAESTNQFDEFRFREEALATAAWSTTDAWVDHQAGGAATMGINDGYANAVLVFRNRDSGDYTATNDLTRIGGQEFLANRIELIGRNQPLTGDGTATINGQGVLLAKSLAGVAPEIKLDASLAGGEYTYDLGLEVLIYDDLTISGNGSERFRMTGGLREARDGRSVAKTGSAELELAGGVDLSGHLDLQGGKATFLDGQVRGSVVARGGVAVQVGPSGIVPGGGGGGGPAPEIVTSGLELNYDAAQDIPGNATWENAFGSAPSLDFGGDRTPVAVDTLTFPALTTAYAPLSVGGASGLNNYFDGPGSNRSRQDATFEVVFNVTSTSAGSDQVILEAGGEARGVAFVLNGDELTFNVDGDQGDAIVTETLAPGWHHAVGVIDLTSGSDTITLYIDNQLAGTLGGQTIDRWAGGNLLGLGDGASSVTGVQAMTTGAPYHGEIALARYYANTAFGATEVDQNYQWLLFAASSETSQPAVVLEIDGDYTQETGASLELDLLDTEEFDRLQASGSISLAGGLVVAGAEGFDPTAGETFTVVSAASLAGEFDSEVLPSLAAGLMWQVDYTPTAVTLQVTLAGDYNGDGSVDVADYTVWRDSLGTMVSPLTHADGDGDGLVTVADYQLWRQNFGESVALGAATIPEPAALPIAVLGIASALARRGAR